jgi:hypothetical protein
VTPTIDDQSLIHVWLPKVVAIPKIIPNSGIPQMVDLPLYFFKRHPAIPSCWLMSFSIIIPFSLRKTIDKTSLSSKKNSIFPFKKTYKKTICATSIPQSSPFL